ncbi:MAG: hypothetical protein GY788_27535 [bacterium]|nr:hypothetical protein [bacterium]
MIEVEGLSTPVAPDHGAPPEGRRPLVVEIRLEITELNQIDELTSSFRFEGLGEFRLCDPRSAFDAGAAGRETLRFSGTDVDAPVWNIKLHIVNGIGPLDVTQRLVEIDADGSIRVFGYFSSSVAATYDLRKFPFDNHVLEIQLESFSYDNESVEFSIRDDDLRVSEDLRPVEWRVASIRARVEDVERHGRASFSRVVVSLDVAREWGFYLFKLWLPLSLIVAFSWIVFWMSDESLVNRVRVASTAFLTVVAYQFAIGGSLPRVAYLTLMDRLMIMSFVLIALSALQSMTSTKMREKDRKRAEGFDRRCRWLFPLAYIAGVLTMAIIYAD